MTKREQFAKNLKEIIAETNWSNSSLAYFAKVAIDCDGCPAVNVCERMDNCYDAIFHWLDTQGNEEEK